MKIKEAKKHEAEQEITARKLEREEKMRQERELMKANEEAESKGKRRKGERK